MKVLLFILFLPIILIIVIPVGGVIIGIGAAIFGVILAISGAILGVIIAILAAIFGGVGSLIGLGAGLIFSKAFVAIILVAILYSLVNRKSSATKVIKS